MTKIDTGIEVDENPCSFLGTEFDSAIIMAFPSKWNICYRSKLGKTPILEHQSQYCLLETHKTCPVFLSEFSASRTEEVHKIFQKRRRKKRNNWLVALLVGILIIVGLFISSLFTFRNDAVPVLKPTSNLIESVPTDIYNLNPNINTPSLTLSYSPTKSTETSTLQPSITPQQGIENPARTIHSLDMPIGITHQFIIHRMKQGESLGGLAIQYNTSVEAITLVNYVLPDPVWVDWLAVIPIDTINVSGFPSFEPKMVVESDMSIEDLAEKLGLDLPSFMFYNGLEAGYLVSTGEWLLIPHSEE